MKRLLLPLCTIISTLAGLYVAQGYRSRQIEVIAPPSIALAPSITSDPVPNSDTDSLSILSAVERLAKEHPKVAHYGEFAARLYTELDDLHSSDFPSAIAAAASTDHIKAADLAALVAGVWAERDLPAARQWVLGLEKDQWYYGKAIFETWGEIDALGMYDWLETHAGEIKSEELRGIVVDITAKTAGRINPEKGLKALNALQAREKKTYSYVGLYEIWARIDPSAAARQAMREPNDRTRSLATEYVLSTWSTRDSAAARAWAEQIPDPVLSRNALVSIGRNLASQESRKGADFLASLPQDDHSRELLGEILRSWKEKDLNAVLQWTAGLSEDSFGLWALRETAKELPPDKIENAIATLAPENRGTIERRWREAQESNIAETKAN